MNKLVKALMVRYCVLLVVGITAALKLTSCAGSYAPIPADYTKTQGLKQLSQLTEPKSPLQVAVKDIAELKAQGSTGLFQVSIIGCASFEGLVVLAAKAQCLDQVPGDGWFETYQARAVALGQGQGKGFLFFTENPYFSQYPIRHLITARFPSNGNSSIEVAKAGVVFRIDERTAPSDQEVHSFVLYFDEPHQMAHDLNQSVWDLVFKYRKTEPVTGDTDSYEGKQQLKRESGDQLWIQITGRSVELRSAQTYEATKEKEQTDHVIDRLISLTIKRIDPASRC